MAMSYWNGPAGRRLEFRQEWQEIRYESDLDRNWTFTDDAGHRHHCDYHAADHYPTLRDIYDEDHWCGLCLGEYKPLIRRECRQCGQEIHTGITGPGVIHVPVLREWRLTETLTGEAAWEAFRAGDYQSGEMSGTGLTITRVRNLTSGEAETLLRTWSTP